MNIITKAKE